MISNLSKLFFKSFTIFLFSFTLAKSQITYAADSSSSSNLIYCKDSAPFQKRLSTSVKKLENRLNLYEKNSKEYLSLIKKIESTKDRFEKYKNQNLLCGKEGLPRIIATGQWDRANEFTIPGILMIYIT